MTASKVPNSYLSICRGPIRDSHGPLFPAVTRPCHLLCSALGGEATLDFPVWKARSVAPWVRPEADLRQARATGYCNTRMVTQAF